MDWREITTPEEAESLLQLCAGFHDGCIKEVYINTRQFVRHDYAMEMPSNATSVHMLVQRQWKDCSALELLFEGVSYFRLPRPEIYDHIIMGAEILFRNGRVIWTDEAGAKTQGAFEEVLEALSAFAVVVEACTLKWRDVSSWLGPEPRYGPGAKMSP